jgi:acetyl/propionyl-CoA carboxylase alpha subunit
VGAAIERLLIANRGEIAVRIARACRERGIASVAVFEPADRAALHTETADEAVEVASYLDRDGIVAAADGCDAVHPGYGFLSEDAGLAEAVERAGLVWVGPPPAAMRALGDKVEARRLAEATGLPVTPGYAGVDLSDGTLVDEATRLGFPVLVKAAAGGGGRGMRRVGAAGELDAALAAARREAEAAFGDGRVYLERALAGVRHVEVQVLCDAHGGAIHLGERDCSVQRRHQKIVEESPSPAVGDDLRRTLGEAAVAMARAAGYRGAGTAEFLLTGDGDWYFLELNARLQVEHPVTEAVAGVDLVHAQLAVAAGEPLQLDQADVEPRGHALECRIYAEDPAAGFVPATGRLAVFDMPRWPGVRVDAGVRAGDRVGVRYDPMLAKVIAHAEDRDACIDRMAAALAEAHVIGVTANVGFLRWVVAHPQFRSGAADTGFVDREWRPELAPALPADVRRAARARLAATASPWYAFSDALPPVRAADGFVVYEGWHHAVGDDDDAHPAAVSGPGGSLTAPMPGAVLRVSVAAGEPVAAGDVLVVLEAMKMELAVSAPSDGTVRSVLVRPGELVSRGQALVELDE